MSPCERGPDPERHDHLLEVCDVMVRLQPGFRDSIQAIAPFPRVSSIESCVANVRSTPTRTLRAIDPA